MHEGNVEKMLCQFLLICRNLQFDAHRICSVSLKESALNDIAFLTQLRHKKVHIFLGHLSKCPPLSFH